MSLEQPFVFPARAIENDIPVNIHNTVTFSKQDKVDVRNRGAEGNVEKTEYCIVFYTNEVAQEGQAIVWRYKDKNCRDSDYNDLKQNFSVSLGS